MRAHLTMSSSRNLRNASGVIVIGTAPWYASDHPRPPTDELCGFAIAGDDRKWVWAKGVIDGTTVVVSSDQVPNPVAVRYGWADNPMVNLYNQEGLPAVPFRTDDWAYIPPDHPIW